MRIESYRFGRIVVAGQEYTSDVIIYPERVDATWWRKAGHELCPEDLAEVMAARPQVLVVGTGKFRRVRVLPETETLLREKGIRLLAADTEAACHTFNQLQQEGDVRVVAALHLTC